MSNLKDDVNKPLAIDEFGVAYRPAGEVWYQGRKYQALAPDALVCPACGDVLADLDLIICDECFVEAGKIRQIRAALAETTSQLASDEEQK